MEYPSLENKLIMPEYGRNIQHMVDYALTIEDRDERNRCAEAIIAAMMQLHPEFNSDEKRHAFYDHLAVMSDFKLDIDYPYAPPQPEEMGQRPNALPYSNPCFPQRHYGKLIQNMIHQASREEDIDKRQALIVMLANHLKYTYLLWNREQVNDEQIIADIERMSEGLLRCDFPSFELLPVDQLITQEEVAAKKSKKKKKK